jgi:DNA-binding MarR family transcriptional regulator
LLKKKLVQKKAGVDKRAHELALTDAGQRFIDKALPLVKDLRKEGIKGMTPSEIKALRSGLSKMIENLS